MTCLPNEYTLSILFKICSQLNDHQSFEFAKKIFEQMPNKYKNNTIIINSALHMFMQYGQILLAENIFEQMNKDTITYGVMMSGNILFNLLLWNRTKLQTFLFKKTKPSRLNFTDVHRA